MRAEDSKNSHNSTSLSPVRSPADLIPSSNTFCLLKSSTELTIYPGTPSHQIMPFSPSTPSTDSSIRHFRMFKFSPAPLNFIPALPPRDLHIPAVPQQDISESFNDSDESDSEPAHHSIYITARLLKKSFTSSFKARERLENAEKILIGTRATTYSNDEIRAFDCESEGRRIYCEKCQENVETEVVYRDAERGLWERIASSVCFRTLGGTFKEVVHSCVGCKNVVARMKYKAEEEYLS